MSKTVSFVIRDDLAEWLESRASEEMKTVSSVVQDIVAAEYRRQQSRSESESDNSQAGGQAKPDGPLKRHPDAWRTLNKSAKNNYAVEHPTEDKTRYYKTRDGAAKRVMEWYE